MAYQAAARPLIDQLFNTLADRLDPPAYGAHSRIYQFYGAASEIQDCGDHELIISGPADTGKTLATLQRLDKLAWQYPGMQAAIIRKTRASMDGSCLQTFTKKILNGDGAVKPFGGEKPAWYDYSNGSRIWVGGMDKPDKVLSSERDVIYVNQAEELSLADWEFLSTRCNGRAGNMPFAQMLGDCNPGAPTHWIKSREKAGSLRLLNSTHRDNPQIFDPLTGAITPGGLLRLAALKSLTGARLLRLFHGLWAQPEGAIYDVFDDTKHKIASFAIPTTWPRAVGIDPYGAFTAAVWLAYNPADATLHLYREYYEPFGRTTPGHVREILSRCGYHDDGRPSSNAETVFAWVGGGPSENQFRLDWAAAGIPLIAPTVTEVWSGIDRVYQLLDDTKLFIHDNCPAILSEIGSYQRKTKDGVVTDEIDNKESFHLLDALRYIVIWLTEPGERTEVSYSPVKIGPDY